MHHISAVVPFEFIYLKVFKKILLCLLFHVPVPELLHFNFKRFWIIQGGPIAEPALHLLACFVHWDTGSFHV